MPIISSWLMLSVEFNYVLTNFSKVCSNTWARVRVWYFNKNKMLKRFRTLFLHLYQLAVPLELQGLGLIKVSLEIINKAAESICLQCGRPGLRRSPGEGNGNPLQYACLENSMDGGAWWAIVHGVAKSRTQLSDFNDNDEGSNGEDPGSFHWGHKSALSYGLRWVEYTPTHWTCTALRNDGSCTAPAHGRPSRQVCWMNKQWPRSKQTAR